MPPHNLPAEVTSFIGREKEIAEVRRLLAGARLLTLTGSGGTGKTRLALRIALEALGDFPDGVWLVDMAPLSDPDLVPQSVAGTLGVRDEPGVPLTRRIAEALHYKNLLLILDNCEHLIQAVANLAEVLLHACPDIKLLVTSREALGISGETAYRVPSLSLPPDGTQTPRAAHLAAQYEAVRLFVDRAATIRPDFALTDANTEAVVQICPEAGWRAPGAGAGRCTRAGPERGPDCSSPGRPLPIADRRKPHGSASPADPARPDRLELGFAVARREAAFQASGRFCGWIDIRGGGVCVPMESSRPQPPKLLHWMCWSS